MYVHTFKGHSIFLDGVDGGIGNDRLASLQDGCNVDLLPLDWDLTELSDDKKYAFGGAYFGSSVDILYGLADFWTNTCEDVTSVHCDA